MTNPFGVCNASGRGDLAERGLEWNLSRIGHGAAGRRRSLPEIVFIVLKIAVILSLYLFIAMALRSLYIDLLPEKRRARAAASRVSRVVKAGRPHLRVLTGKSKPDRFELESETVIGRGAECQVCLDDEFVSQLHARIFRAGEAYMLEDLGSTNGTYVNGSRINYPVGLRHGDRIGIGRTVLEFRE